ncbi:hypothetical protein [Sulfurimonas sp. HSL3-2]|uniref:hypothetical protein n=1 Tax=Hydrocurvibacter mobilis TaxID=3131936 RepID=UPI0031F9D986
MNFEQIDLTGCRLIGAIWELGHIGPKHHAVIIGKNLDDDLIYIAENMHTGYQLVTLDDFKSRYSKNGDIKVQVNDGNKTNLEVAQDALNVIYSKTKKKYNLISNNCESFVNQVTHGHSISTQVLTTIGGLILIAGIWYLQKKNGKII